MFRIMSKKGELWLSLSNIKTYVITMAIEMESSISVLLVYLFDERIGRSLEQKRKNKSIGIRTEKKKTKA